MKLMSNTTAMTDEDEKNTELSDQEIRFMLASNRLSNKICNSCHKKDKKTLAKLVLCKECCLTWYCGPRCQQRDQLRHKLWCCNPKASIDQGPMKTMILNQDE